MRPHKHLDPVNLSQHRRRQNVTRRSLGRVLPGQRMAGHTGCETVSMMKIKVMKVIPEQNLLLLNGSVPGPNGGTVYIVKTVKAVPKPPVVAAKKAKSTAKAAPKKAAKK